MNNHMFSKLKLFWITVFFTSVLACSAYEDKQNEVVFIPPQTPMLMIARTDISTEKNQLGDQILMQLAAPVFSGSELALPIGMLFEAEISDLVKAGENGKEAYLDITVKNIVTHSGTRIPMLAKLNHQKLSLVTNKKGAYSKISPENIGKPFVIKRGVNIPFVTSETLRFEHDMPVHKMVPKETNIRDGLSKAKHDTDFIPFFDPSLLRERRNAFEDPAKIYRREKNKNPYF